MHFLATVRNTPSRTHSRRSPMKWNYKPIRLVRSAVERNVLQVPTKHDRFGRPPLLMFLSCPTLFLLSSISSRVLPSPLFLRFSVAFLCLACYNVCVCCVCGAISRSRTFSPRTSVVRVHLYTSLNESFVKSRFDATRGGRTVGAILPSDRANKRDILKVV